MKISKEVKIGLFAFAMLIVFYWGINFLNKNERLTRTNTFYVVYDNANGLQRKSPVVINGVNIGSVSNIALNSGRNQVVVTMLINSEYMLPVGTTATVSSGGILDKKNIVLTLGNSTTLLNPNDTLKNATSSGGLMELMNPMAGKADSLISRLNAIAGSLQNMLNAQNQANLSKSLDNFAKLSSNLNSATDELNGLLSENRKQIGSMVNDLNATSSNLNSISGNLKNSNAEITALIKNADATLANTKALSATLNKHADNGTLLHVMQNDSLYINLNRTINDLDALLVDLKKNPNDYVHLSVFGGKKKK